MPREEGTASAGTGLSAAAAGGEGPAGRNENAGPGGLTYTLQWLTLHFLEKTRVETGKTSHTTPFCIVSTRISTRRAK